MPPRIRDLFFLKEHETTPTRALAWFNSGCVLLLVALLFACVILNSQLSWNWEVVGEYWRLYWGGWRTTVALALCALLVSTLFGAVLALAQRSRFLPGRFFAKGCVAIVRGTPLLAQIYILFYIVAEAIGLENRFIAGVLALSIFSGAYISEIIRASLDTVGRSQIESAMAIGLTRFQTYRHVILPQAMRSLLPPLAGQFVSLIKDSSLLSIIGLNELTQSARNVASYTLSNFESYLLMAAGYLLLTLPVSLLSRRLEKRASYET